MIFGFNWPSNFRGKSFEIVDGRRRTTGTSHPMSSPGGFGSGELK